MPTFLLLYVYIDNCPETRGKENMDWIKTRKRGPEWKQGWTDQTLDSFSAPPLPLMAVFAIVVFLLSLSQFASYKEQMHATMVGFKLLLLLLPVFLVFFLRSSLITGVGVGRRPFSQHGRYLRQDLAHGMAGFPWGMVVLVVVLLVLVSYQSSFQSKWFPLVRSD